VRGGEIPADADHDEAGDPDPFGPRKGGIGPLGEVLRIEMAMRVDERRDPGFGHAVSYLAMDEQAFRRLLDQDGLLRPGALTPPSPAEAFTVFAQRPDAVLDIVQLGRQAERFFGTKLGLTVDKRYSARTPDVDAARIVVASAAGSGTRLCYGRPSDDRDQAAAEAAERKQSSSGMSLLALRCPMVWLVASEGTPAPNDEEDDKVALALAAILASVLLGPILSPRGDELFGVKTARLKLERS
jgi:hypothetical protein